MKTKLILLTILAAGFVFAASAPSVTESLVRIQTDPASGQVQAYFEKTVTVEGTAFKQPWESVSWPIGAEKSVTVGGKTYTYGEVLSAVVAIAAQERAEQLAAAQQGGGQ